MDSIHLTFRGEINPWCQKSESGWAGLGRGPEGVPRGLVMSFLEPASGDTGMCPLCEIHHKRAFSVYILRAKMNRNLPAGSCLHLSVLVSPTLARRT